MRPRPVAQRAPRIAVASAALALGACSAVPPMPDPPSTHPASPAAAASPRTAPSTTLSLPGSQPSPGATEVKR